MNKPDINIFGIVTKTSVRGLLFNILIPGGLLVIMMLIGDKNVMDESGAASIGETLLQLPVFLMLFLSAVGFGVVYYIRRILPESLLVREGISVADKLEGSIQKISMIIFGINLLHSLFGLILVTIGNDLRVMTFFVALSFIGYQLFRPRQDFVEKVLEKIQE